MKRLTLLLFYLVLAVAEPATAQAPAVDAAAEHPSPDTPGTFALEQPDGGSPQVYQVDDVSVSVTRSLDQRGDAKADVSVSLGTLRPMDTFLLEWARSGATGPAASRRALITVTSRQPSGPVVLRYELEGAKVLSFMASHSASAGASQLMLQVSALRVTLNGVVLN